MLEKVAANYMPLSPIGFLARTAQVYPDRVAVRYGDLSVSYHELQKRCIRLASALVSAGINRGDVVSILAPNIPAHLEAHFGVPMAGAVLHSINMRLDASTVAFMLQHASSRLLIVDAEFLPLAQNALLLMEGTIELIVVEDPAVDAGIGGRRAYETLLQSGDDSFVPLGPADEWDAIALNYTSGTTGDPKGVVYHHRGAYLNAIANTLAWNLSGHPTYLWTLPMFHCNGWCFPWTITALAGTHVCLRRVDSESIVDAITRTGVTHLAGAPIILSRIVGAPDEMQRTLPSGLHMMVAGAPPTPTIIAEAERLGLTVTQTYGLTEVYGPCVVCEWKEEWDELPLPDRARLKARQGVRYQMQESLDVLDPETMTAVPADGLTMGEIMIRGNITMKGYLGNPKATAEAFSGGWFHSGDLAVKHPDGYVEIRDRSKDIIISGGENISTVEIEAVLVEHPGILEAAVVAKRDKRWGEVPCAFVTARPGIELDAEDVIALCRARLAHFKVPKFIVIADIPKTSTGKVQKFVLREKANALGV
ncbi:AMP-binding protein [Sphingobium sp. HWE2-09]|uniref:AMP-binding protein n=1 Tax=Sphingobium sp. HWE2-09 TaxID=3108390 RepID=UPI002DCEA65B|nr:AMP-binding protein [Sphingobium sp. HWE2-09]